MIWVFRFYLFWYACGFVLLTFDLIPPSLEWANAVFLILAGTLGGLYFIKQFGSTKGGFYSLFVIAVSMAVEHLGAEYNLWFGQYHYEQDFGPQIAGVPISIGFAWLMIIAGSHEIAKVLIGTRKHSFFFFLLLASALTVSIDLILDPVAYKVKEYWIWDEPGFYYGVPLSNFTGWFFLSMLFHLIGWNWIQPMDHEPKWGFRMFLIFESVQGMFVWLAFISQLWLAGILVGSIMVVTSVLYIRMRNSYGMKT